MKHLFPTLDAEEAAALVNDGDVVAVSGFTGSGHPKLVPPAIASRAREAHQRGASFKITLYSGASTGDEVDGELARASAISKRLPYQSCRELREQINSGEVAYVDMHLSSFGGAIRSGAIPAPDIAIIEAYRITPDGRIFLPPSAGNTAVFCSAARKIIVECSDQFGDTYDGLHDSYELLPPPQQGPIPIRKVLDRIGVPYVQVDPAKIVGVVSSNTKGTFPTFTAPNPIDRRIAENVLGFILHEKGRGRIPTGLPFQVGVGNIANAALALMAQDSRIEPLTMYTEVIQDSVFDLIDSGKLVGASTAALSFSEPAADRFQREISSLRDLFVLRPVEISNHPEVIRRLGVISLNTAVEIDIFGNVNSTHVQGSSMLNGIGGSGDFCRNAFLSLYITRSVTRNGSISTIVPAVTHVDHNEHSVRVVITEHGVADLRGLSPNERAPLVIGNCAHPSYRPALYEFLERARSNAAGRHTPTILTEAFSFQRAK